MELLKKRLANLLAIKSIVTVILTVVIAFYFGTQAEKRSQEAAETMTGTLVLSDTKGGDGNGDGAATT